MELSHFGFFALAAVTLSSAIMSITRRSAVHSAIFLIITLLSVGGDQDVGDGQRNQVVPSRASDTTS